MEQDFVGKVVLVTGGGSGIGKATCLHFAQRGAKVAVVARHRESAEATAKAVGEQGGEAVAIVADVSRGEEAEQMVEEAVRAFRRLDFAINNAGIGGEVGTVVDCTEDNWDRVMGVNLRGVWLSMKYEIPHLLKQETGCIVNLSSAHGLRGAPGMSAYAASKGGVIQLTRSAALEFADQGLRINAICPAHIDTPALAAYIDHIPDLDDLGEHLPMKRMGRPEEVAAAATWLCSEESSFVTGHALGVDAGMNA